MSLIKEYLELTIDYISQYGENTIVLMQVGAFYESYGLKNNDIIYGSNIVKFGEICDLNVVDKKASINDIPVVMAGFKDHLIDKYIRKLQDTGFTIVVFSQDEQRSNTTRSLTGIFSPGSYFSLDVNNITNNNCCIWVNITEYSSSILKSQYNKIYIGCSVIDIYTGKTNLMEFNEIYINNPNTYDNLERYVSIYNPSETIIIANMTKSQMINVTSYANIKSKMIHYISLLETPTTNKNITKALNCEKQNYQSQLLAKFYNFDDYNVFMQNFNNNIYATQSFCYLLDFIYSHNPHLVYKIEEPVFENINNDKLILANHSLKQLNIIDTDSDYVGQYSSVVKILNKCITSMGKRRFSHMILNPVSDETYLINEYNITEHLLKINTDPIKHVLQNFCDISKINRQIMLNKISPKTIYNLFNSIVHFKILYDLTINDTILCEYLNTQKCHLDQLLEYCDEIQSYLNKSLILEDCKDIDNINKVSVSFIKPGVNNNLDSQIKLLLDSEDQLECCRHYFNNIVVEYETKTKKSKSSEELNETQFIKIHETEKNHFSLISTDRRCKILEEKILKNKETNVNLTYISSFDKSENTFKLELDNIEYTKHTATNRIISSIQINKLCKNINMIKINLMDEIANVYFTIVKELEQFQTKLECISDVITLVDIVYTKSYIAQKYNYCKPEIVSADKSFVNAQGLRHCIIELLQQSELYVSNNMCLGDGITDGILLYGTNAVGKTSFIRALGISIIMAQAGLFVPASSFKFKPYKYLFTRILGNDNIFKGLSTFAVEMSELRSILRLSNKYSLVLGDELCSGTESISAISIFVVGIQTMQRNNCSFIFATHQHEIVNFDEITSLANVRLKHMTVVYDKEKDLLIYDRKIKDGPGVNMYGLEVCKSLNLPDDFLCEAHKIRTKYFPPFVSVLDQQTSHFNAHVIKGICEKCGIHNATEVHHLQHQQDANDNGFISSTDMTFHKNHPANLIALCNNCHNEFHSSNVKHKKVKTSKGIKIQQI